jgi:hypothetical protein
MKRVNYCSTKIRSIRSSIVSGLKMFHTVSLMVPLSGTIRSVKKDS